MVINVLLCVLAIAVMASCQTQINEQQPTNSSVAELPPAVLAPAPANQTYVTPAYQNPPTAPSPVTPAYQIPPSLPPSLYPPPGTVISAGKLYPIVYTSRWYDSDSDSDSNEYWRRYKRLKEAHHFVISTNFLARKQLAKDNVGNQKRWAPTDYHVNRSLKNWQTNKVYIDLDDLVADVKAWIGSIQTSHDFFARGIDFLPSKWEAVIEVDDDYAPE